VPAFPLDKATGGSDIKWHGALLGVKIGVPDFIANEVKDSGYGHGEGVFPHLVPEGKDADGAVVVKINLNGFGIVEICNRV